MAGKNTDRTRIGPRVQRLLKAVTGNGVEIGLILQKGMRIVVEMTNTFQMPKRNGGAEESPLDQTRREVIRRNREQ